MCSLWEQKSDSNRNIALTVIAQTCGEIESFRCSTTISDNIHTAIVQCDRRHRFVSFVTTDACICRLILISSTLGHVWVMINDPFGVRFLGRTSKPLLHQQGGLEEHCKISAVGAVLQARTLLFIVLNYCMPSSHGQLSLSSCWGLVGSLLNQRGWSPMLQLKSPCSCNFWSCGGLADNPPPCCQIEGLL